MLELVVNAAVLTGGAPLRGPIPPARAICGLRGITIWTESGAQWERLLTAGLGIDVVAEAADFDRYSLPGEIVGVSVDVQVMQGVSLGLAAVGYVDHAAFRVPDRDLDDWRSRLAQHAGTLSPIKDHMYYRAVLLEGPEGVRLELASNGPGVTVDEVPEELGTHLVLPPWLEAQRSYLEVRLPPLQLPGARR